MTDPVSFFRSVAARHRRCFWLDGGGAREWSGRRSIIGWLDDDDASLSWSAARREVTLHAGGVATVVGDDVSPCSSSASRRGSSGSATSATPRAPTSAATPDPTLPDAVWMRPRAVRVFEHAVPGSDRGATSLADSPLVRGVRHLEGEISPTVCRSSPPGSYERAFARVQEHLHAGNSYEVNLTHRLSRESGLDPVTAYLRLRELNPAPYSGFLQHDVDGARAWLLSSSPERYALVTADRHLETKPIKGTPRAGRPSRRTSTTASGSRATRRPARRT